MATPPGLTRRLAGFVASPPAMPDDALCIAQTGFIDVWRRRLHALGLAKTLEAMGRDREAAAVIEDVLGHDDPNDLPLALIILAELARLSEKLALPVDSKWLRLAEAVAKYHDVGMPTDGSPAKAILDLEGIIRSRQQGGSER